MPELTRAAPAALAFNRARFRIWSGLSRKGHPPASVAPAGGRTLGADRKVRPRNYQLCRPASVAPAGVEWVEGVAGLPLATPSLLWRPREDYHRRQRFVRVVKNAANSDLPCAFS